MSIIKNAFIFTTGAAIGSAIAWYLTKTKYEKILQEEIDSVKETFARRQEKLDEEREAADKAKNKADISEYADKIRECGYDYGGLSKEYEQEEMKVDKPYIIPPEELGTLDGYSQITLLYYADGILADEDGELVDDVENIVGLDSLEHFGEYEDDSVCVRNDRLKVDYEILLDLRSYSGNSTSPQATEE